jgi:phosphate-selective porin OprO/OprP
MAPPSFAVIAHSMQPATGLKRRRGGYRLITGSLLITLLAAFSAPLSIAAESESDRLAKLEAAVETLQKENADLKREVSELKRGPQRTSSAKATSAIDSKSYVEPTEAEKKPVYIKPEGAELKLTLGGYIQANLESGDVSAFEGRFSNGPNEVRDRFRLRRARIHLIGDFAEKFDFKIEGDFQQGDGLSGGRTGFSATDIFINWHEFPEANVKVGQWKAPFGLEQLTSATTLFIIERSLVTGAITPQRQVGAQIWGKPFTNLWPEERDLLTYYAGIFNGNGRNTITNDNNNFMYVGRLELLAWHGELLGQKSSLKLGGDVLHSRDAAGVNISQTLNLKVNSDGSLTPFVLPSAAERTAWSLDAWWNIGRFDLIAEYLSEDVRGRTVAPTFANFSPSGWYVEGGYYILPKKLQAVLKWEEMDPGQVTDDNIRSLTLGFNYYIHGDSIKVMADYIHTWSDFRTAHPQLGNDEFDEMILRLQVMF